MIYVLFRVFSEASAVIEALAQEVMAIVKPQVASRNTIASKTWSIVMALISPVTIMRRRFMVLPTFNLAEPIRQN